MIDKQRVKEVMDEVDELDLSESAYWMMVHHRLDLPYGDVFQIIADDPDYFGAKKL